MDERIKEILPQCVDLCPIEWDTLSKNKDVLHFAFEARTFHPFYALMFSYDENETISAYIDKLLFDMEQNGIPKKVFEEAESEVIDWLYDHNESDPVNEMFEKSLPVCCYVQLLNEDYRTLNEFAKALGVDVSAFDDIATGQFVEDGDRIFSGLRIYFMCNPKDFVECHKVQLDGKFWVVLWDSWNGCGEETEVELHLTIEEPHLDVDYTENDVTKACGLVQNWADNDGVIKPLK